MTTTPFYPNDIAQGVTLAGSFAPLMLWAGDLPINNSRALVGATAIVRFQPLAYDGTGLLIPWNPAGSGTALKIVGVAQDNAAVGSGLAFWTGGCLNNELIVWPSGYATLQLRKQAFAEFGPSGLQVDAVLGAQYPT